MSWSDLFYPGNPGKRDEVVRKFTKIMVLMEGNFKHTNDLIDMLHTYLPGRTFLKIEVNDDKTIKENCDVMIAKVNEINAYIEEKSLKLREMLDPELYEQIMSTTTSFGEKLELGRKIAGATIGTIGSVAGIAAIALIKTGKILVKIVDKVGKFATSALAGIGIGVVTMGIDMIASAIIGAVERDQLDASIADLNAALLSFDPASYEFSKSIEKLIARIEIAMED